MDTIHRKKLHDMVLKARTLLIQETSELLEGRYGILKNGEDLGYELKETEQNETLNRLRSFFKSEIKSGLKEKEAFNKLVREVAFTHLNRFVAFKMMETRKLIQQTITKGTESNGFKFYLVDNSEDYDLWKSGDKDTAYRHFLLWKFSEIAEELEILFDPNNLPSRLFPRPRVLRELLSLINSKELTSIWIEDETIGWVYQYFIEEDKAAIFEKIYTHKQKMDLRDIAPATQLFTPKWIVRYLVENTLGRLWIRMHPDSKLRSKMKYYVPNSTDDAQIIPVKPVKDITLLDPACGTMHFGLVAFDLFYEMYEEELTNKGKHRWPRNPSVSNLEKIPETIVSKNLFGIDLDLRAIQLSALTLYIKVKSKNKKADIKKLNLTYTDIPPFSEEIINNFIDNLSLKYQTTRGILKLILPLFNKAYYLGSLLKIEKVVQEFLEKERKSIFQIHKQANLFMTPEKQQLLLNEKTTWEEVRDEINRTFRTFINKGVNGLENFIAGESIKGLSLIDALVKKHDVVVCNPPYSGRRNMNEILRKDLKTLYPQKNNDLYSAFIARSLELVNDAGFVGMINIHSFMFISSYKALREDLLENTTIENILHLGPTFMELSNPYAQQCVAYVLRKEQSRIDNIIICFRMIYYINEEKIYYFEKALKDWLENGEDYNDRHIYLQKQEELKNIPGWPFIYWVSGNIRSLFLENESLLEKAKPCQGLSTTDNFRFLRLWWENSYESIFLNCESHNEAMKSDLKWFPYMKGGAYNKWYGNQDHLVYWGYNGEQIKETVVQKYPYLHGNPDWVVKNTEYYFQEGVTYSFLTTSNLSVRYLPFGFIFDVAGSSVFPNSRDAKLILGILNSKLVTFIIKLLNPTVNYQVGDIARIPFPDYSKHPELTVKIAQITQSCIHLKRSIVQKQITSWEFIVPPSWQKRSYGQLEKECKLTLLESDINDIVYKLYELKEEDINQVESEFGTLPGKLKKVTSERWGNAKENLNKIKELYLNKNIPEVVLKKRKGTDNIDDKDRFKKKQDRRQTRYLTFEEICLATRLHPGTVYKYITNNRLERGEELFRLAVNWIEYAFGIIMGRFQPGNKDSLGSGIINKKDFITGSLNITKEEFEEITKDFHVAYIDEKEKHYFSTEVEKNLCEMIDEDSIMVLDEGHQDDLSSKIEEVLNLMLGEIQTREIVTTIGGSLSRFLERGFFGKHHIKMYRKRPIYWLLQTKSKNYGFYIFHEKIDNDMLFKILRNYIDPKLNLISSQIIELNKKNFSNKGKNKRNLEKEIENLELLYQEIKDFSAAVNRVTEIKNDSGKIAGYNPDINDGVILNMAPLHELIPWKEPKKYWKELKEGKYDWSHIAMRYWPKRVKEKCKRDKSLAIAHGLEVFYED